jgi:hypothetical protein
MAAELLIGFGQTVLLRASGGVGGYPMKPGWALFALAATMAAIALYALDRGVYVGSSIYPSPYIQDQYDKDCRYLSLVGVRSRQSGGGPTPQAADDNGYCPLFQK